MNALVEGVAQSRLFAGIGQDDLARILEPESLIASRFNKHAVLLQEGEPLHCVGIILNGTLSVFQLSPSGETVKIQSLPQGDFFGLALMHSKNQTYPYTLVANTAAGILYIPFAKIEELMQKIPDFRRNVMECLSERISMYQMKIRVLSQNSVRSRIILYLAHQAENKRCLCFSLEQSKTEIAELLGIARPSLSRELKRMRQDGLLTVEKDVVLILKQKAFSLTIGSLVP